METDDQAREGSWEFCKREPNVSRWSKERCEKVTEDWEKNFLPKLTYDQFWEVQHLLINLESCVYMDDDFQLVFCDKARTILAEVLFGIKEDDTKPGRRELVEHTRKKLAESGTE